MREDINDVRLDILETRLESVRADLEKHKESAGVGGGCLVTILFFLLLNVLLRIVIYLAHQLPPPHTDDLWFFLTGPIQQVLGKG